MTRHPRAGGRPATLLALASGLALLAASPPASPAGPLQLQRDYAGEALLDQFGYAVAGVGDFDGDGREDFVAGANVNDELARSGGKIYFFPGGSSLPDSATASYAGAVEKGYLGAALAGGGDFDGDGWADLVAGADGLGADGLHAGRAYLFLGGPGADLVPDLVLEGSTPGGRFGAAVCLGGDLDGDGLDDLVVGAPRDGEGSVSIYLGRAGGWPTTPDQRLVAPAGDMRFGSSLAVLPDRDGDGDDELLVGAPRSGRLATWAGAVLLYEGGATLATTPQLVFTAGAAGDELGRAIWAGADLDGDLVADLVAGAPLANPGGRIDAGTAWVFPAGPAAGGQPTLRLDGAAAGDLLGCALTAGVDHDGDGQADIVLGAPGDSRGGEGAGALEVYLGGIGLDGIPDASILGDSTALHLGTSVAAAGDLRGDGRAALLGGGYNSSDNGRVLLLAAEATVVSTPGRPAPGELSAYPNPFNPRLVVSLSAPVDGPWQVDLFDPRGRRVARLFHGRVPGGALELVFDGRGEQGDMLPSGSYFLRASTPAGHLLTRGVRLVR